MKRIFLMAVVLVAMMARTVGVFAQQHRQYLCEALEKHSNARNIALTHKYGALALYGKNGCARKGIPSALETLINQYNKESRYINDIVISDKGEWLILYGDNGCKWSKNVPEGMKNKIKEYNRNQEKITTAVFNDAGRWVVVSNKHFSASHDALSRWLREGTDKYGRLWTVCLTDNGVVAIYENGYRIDGTIPQEVSQALNGTNINVYRLKIHGNDWFFANEDGSLSRHNIR